MEIKISISLNDENKIVLETNNDFIHIFNETSINANDIYKMLSYEKDNSYVLEPLLIDEATKSKEYKIAKPLYDLIKQIIDEVNLLNVNDSKVSAIELEEEPF